MRKTMFAALCILLMLFAFTSCSNDSGQSSGNNPVMVDAVPEPFIGPWYCSEFSFLDITADSIVLKEADSGQIISTTIPVAEIQMEYADFVSYGYSLEFSYGGTDYKLRIVKNPGTMHLSKDSVSSSYYYIPYPESSETWVPLGETAEPTPIQTIPIGGLGPVGKWYIPF